MSETAGIRFSSAKTAQAEAGDRLLRPPQWQGRRSLPVDSCAMRHLPVSRSLRSSRPLRQRRSVAILPHSEPRCRYAEQMAAATAAPMPEPSLTRQVRAAASGKWRTSTVSIVSR